MKILKNLQDTIQKKYPLIWNTRILYVLFFAFWVHLIFFVIGYFYLNDQVLQQSYLNIEGIQGLFLTGSIISLILILIWMVYYFKNNAFKNFYPVTSQRLFGEFLILLGGIFYSISFYMSFITGIQAKLATHYPESELSEHIDVVNKIGFMLPYNVFDYNLFNKQMPSYFKDKQRISVEPNNKKALIDSSKATVFDGTYAFQFFTLKEVFTDIVYDTVNEPYPEYFYNFKDSLYQVYKEEYGNYLRDVSNDENRRIYLALVDSIYDVEPQLETKKPSLLHSSIVMSYVKNQKYNNTNILGWESTYNLEDTLLFGLKEYHYNLLNQRKKSEIEDLMSQYISIADHYTTERNIDAKFWLNFAYNPDKNYEIPFLIYREIYEDEYGSMRYLENNNDVRQAETAVEPSEYSENSDRVEVYPEVQFKSYYLDSESLTNIFKNVYQLRYEDQKTNLFWGLLYTSFVLALLLFAFRITDIRTLIFTIVVSGIIAIVFGLFALIVRGEGLGLAIIGLIITGVIIGSGVLFSYHSNKFQKGITILLTLSVFPLFLLALYGLIYEIYRINNPDYEYEFIFQNPIQFMATILVLTLLFYYFYMKKVLLWRAMPS